MGLGLSKFAYAGLVLLWLLIPGKRFDSARTRLLMAAAILFATAVALIGWSLVADGLYLTYDQYNPQYRDFQALTPGVNPSRQFALVLQEPVQFLLRYVRSVISERLHTSFIATLGWLDTPFPNWYIRGYVVLLLGVALIDRCKTVTISFGQRLGMLAVLSWCLVFFGILFYIQWNPVGAPGLIGLQGRYFIPLGPLMFIILYAGNRIEVDRRILNLSLAAVLAGSQLFMLFTVVQRYYGWFG